MDFNYPENSLVVVGALLRLVVCSLRIVGPCCRKMIRGRVTQVPPCIFSAV